MGSVCSFSGCDKVGIARMTAPISDVTLVRLFKDARKTMDLPTALRHVIEHAPRAHADSFPDVVTLVAEEVARRHGLPDVAAMFGRDRSYHLRDARTVAWWVTSDAFDVSSPVLAAAYGGRKHSTVIGALASFQLRLLADDRLRAEVAAIEAAVRRQLERGAA